MNLLHVRAISALLVSLMATLCVAQECIAPVEYIAQDDDLSLGSYERVSPDGRYILRSFSGSRLGDVTLAEIVQTPQGKRIVHHATPLKNEAFPVQGSWRYLVNTNGDHYLLKDILELGVKAKPKFRGGMTGFYAAAAELPAERDGEVRIRSFSWPNNAANSSAQGVGALSVRTLTVDAASHRITADTGAQYLCKERRAIDGTQYGLPMISVDGTEFSAVPQSPRVATGPHSTKLGEQTMRVYSLGNDINAPKCEQRADLQFASGKATFGFSQSGRADLVFEYRGDVWWYVSALKESFNLADYRQTALVGAFPGITKDGRVIVASTWLEGSEACKTRLPSASAQRECQKRNGYAIIDPYQSAAYRNYLAEKKVAVTKACITN
jgi:hypothetical protein